MAAARFQTEFEQMSGSTYKMTFFIASFSSRRETPDSYPGPRRANLRLMLRFVRQLVAVLVAVAWIAGLAAPTAFADAQPASSAAAAAHETAPCHGGDPSHNPGPDTGKPCPFFSLCAAKCFQALPTAVASAAVWNPVASAGPDFANNDGDGHLPSPPLKIPRA